MHSSESYAGTYRLEYLPNGWRLLYANGRPVGAVRSGGVYAAARFFNV